MRRNGFAASAALAILSTIIGAGFASGREVIVFFTRFGAFSWLGIIITAACFGGLTYGVMRLADGNGGCTFQELANASLGKYAGAAAGSLYAIIMLITAGAMAGGMGEIAQIFLPIYHAKLVGVLAGAAICGLAATKGIKALATGATFLLPVCVLLYIILARFTPRGTYAPSYPPPSPALFIPHAIGYACMNVTLCCCLLCEIGKQADSRERRVIMFIFVPSLLLLLITANATLLPRLAMLGNEPLPIVKLAHGIVPAMLLSAAALLLAMATTLIALIRSTAMLIPARQVNGGVSVNPIVVTLISAVCAMLGMVGFNNLIGTAYPIMGCLAAIALIAIIIGGSLKLRPRAAQP